MKSDNYKAYYFVGIGGIGMSAIARYFNALGKLVAGYDKTETTLTKALVTEGIAVHYTDDIQQVSANFLSQPDTLVVITPAVPAHHSELNYFIKHNFTILKRAAVLGHLTNTVKGIAVAGTHGKTTVSSMIGHLLHQSKIKAAAILGGILTNYQSNLLLPEEENEYTVVEADEFDRSLLQLYPYMAVITTIDADHLDIYKDLKDVQSTFDQFVSQIQENGILLHKLGLPIRYTLETESKIDIFDYSIEGESDFRAENINKNNGCYSFDLRTPTQLITQLELSIPGLINIENAVAASSIAWLAGATESEIRTYLKSFKGIKRRFEYHINQEEGTYIDDYAHHPTELNAVISSVRAIYPNKKITGIFQPHLYSRTNDFSEGFAKSLSLLDEVILLDIYPAREEPIEGVTSNLILDQITTSNKVLIAKNELVNFITQHNSEVILTLGAGDIDQYVVPIYEALLKKWGINNTSLTTNKAVSSQHLKQELGQ